jgi:UDPglucose 6-dehydrogenase
MSNSVTVIGIGKLGLGFALLLEKSGYYVCGVDKNEDYVKDLNRSILHSLEPGYNELLTKSTNFHATTSLEEGLTHSNIIFIIINTPNSGGHKFYDHSYLSNLLAEINKYKVNNKNFIIGCTVMPKYIDEIGKFLISDCKDCTMSYNPEFVAQGNIVNGFLKPDLILIGTTSKLVETKLKEIYIKMCDNEPEFCIMKPLEAEITKIGINGYITTKLSFANMMSDVCDNVGADKFKVLKSIGSDTRIGNKYFKPGYSFGGPCFPRDTKALKIFVNQSGCSSGILNETTNYNEQHVIHQVNQIVQQLIQDGNYNYTIENVSFKEDQSTFIIEESAKLKIANILVSRGYIVKIKDIEPIINEVKKEYGNIFEYEVKEN